MLETLIYEMWLEDEDPEHKSKHTFKKAHVTGKSFTFHGAFNSKQDAKRKEKEVPGSFIRHKNGRFYVLKPR